MMKDNDISALNLPPEIESRLRRYAINKISEIQNKVDEISYFVGFGHIRASIIREQLKQYEAWCNKKTGAVPQLRGYASNTATEMTLKAPQLTEREKQVFIMRFGMNKKKTLTLQEIADSLGGISRERVRQIEAKAMRKVIEILKLREVLNELSQ